MKHKRKEVIYYGLTIAIVCFLFPFLLNWILQRKAIVPVVGDSTTWLSFWPVYLSAIASFCMIFFTYLSLKQNAAQMEDMRARDIEEHRARLVFSVIVYQTAFYLRISNIGKENAFAVRLIINEDFIEQIKDSFQKYFRKLADPFFIEAGKSVYTLIGWCEDVNKEWEGKEIILTIKGSYNEKYPVNESLDMDYFIDKTNFVVKGDLETTMDYIKKGVMVQNNTYMPIQKSLDIIAKSIGKIGASLEEITESIQSKTNEEDNDESINTNLEENNDTFPQLKD